MSAFHTQNGLWFERLPDESVEVTATTAGKQRLDAATWASVLRETGSGTNGQRSSSAPATETSTLGRPLITPTPAKDALALVRGEVESALQCATDDHTKYHLRDVPGMLDEAEKELAAREKKLLGGNRVLTQKISTLRESAQRSWESLEHYVSTRTEEQPCGFCGSWGEHDNDACDLVAVVTSLEEDFGCGERLRGETIKEATR